MKGRDPLAVVAGIVLTLGGIALLIASVILHFLIIYALIVLALGIAILSSLRKQEEIEQVVKNKKDRGLRKR